MKHATALHSALAHAIWPTPCTASQLQCEDQEISTDREFHRSDLETFFEARTLDSATLRLPRSHLWQKQLVEIPATFVKEACLPTSGNTSALFRGLPIQTSRPDYGKNIHNIHNHTHYVIVSPVNECVRLPASSCFQFAGFPSLSMPLR